MSLSTLTAAPSSAQAIIATPAHERVFGWREHAALWFSLGVGLLVMQIGAYLVPAVGTRDAVLAIVAGSLIGAGLLGWAARLGCEYGVGSAGLMHQTFGPLFARLPVLLNIVQLIGWTSFELVVMRDGTLAIAGQALGHTQDSSAGLVLSTLLWGGLLMLLMAGSMLTLVRKFIGRYGLPLVIVSLLWLTLQFGGRLHAQGLQAFWDRQGAGGMSLLSAIDLVIAMPVSWLPLVADYARHGRSGRAALGGTWLGYAVANIWCYALGVLVASVTEPGTDLVTALLLAQGGLVALSLILVDEIDNAYGDVYSGASAGRSLWARWSLRRWGMGLALLCTALALVLPMHSIEPFLLLLSSVFVPLFGVILGRLGGDKKNAESRNINYGAAALWIIGIVVYHGLTAWAPDWGSALPTLVLTWLLARLTRARASA